MKTTQLQDDPNDSWARVELYRWQHGALPGPDEKSLNEAEGFRAMANAIERGDRNNFPTPHNVVSVLRYAAKIIEIRTP